ncbi:MAG TPA: hypothetical protein VJ914_37515 [Pseudonocardiaceae bacterium]|nr:hypothetical protein [Pseudonocardiaceae bacterium]
MHAPITVNYVPDGEDWTVTVTDEDKTQKATASGLIAARDQADQIVEKMVPGETSRTVVHLLEGDAVAFTNTYLQVRLGLTTPEDPQPELPAEPVTAQTPDPEAAPSPAEESTAPTPPAEAAPSDNSPELTNVPAQGANQAS